VYSVLTTPKEQQVNVETGDPRRKSPGVKQKVKGLPVSHKSRYRKVLTESREGEEKRRNGKENTELVPVRFIPTENISHGEGD